MVYFEKPTDTEVENVFSINCMNPRLIDFIVEHTHLEPAEIRPELRLAKDVGLYGLDALLFLEDFFTEFEITHTEAFDVDLHVSGSVDFAPRPLNWLKNILYKERRKFLSPDVTIGHLEKVLETGSWFSER